MSYIIDIYKKKVEAQRNLFDLVLYFTIFPQLVAGPIVRYNTIAFQLHVRTVTADKFSEGIRHFIIGLGKKVLIANQLGAITDEIFTMDPATMSVSTAWIGAIAYTLQIFFDFSGYSDMAIGVGKMFGLNRSLTDITSYFYVMNYRGTFNTCYYYIRSIFLLDQESISK
ncbi:D-alanyl-lipoteichoic acid acyltransferase DltB (MBOAT superfamily) [Bacillus sp. RC251]|nr:Protein of unknown function [Bacillus wiedmannii]